MAQSEGLFEQIMASTRSAVGSLRVRSALNPMLWLCAIITLPCLGLSFKLSDGGQTALISIAASPVFATIIGFFVLLYKAPEKLQSEEFQIRHEALELIRQKGSNLKIAPSSLDAITNPESKRNSP